MKRLTSIGVTAAALAVTTALALSGAGSTVLAQGRGSAPNYRVDPLWPQPLPNHWVWGSITGVAVVLICVLASVLSVRRVIVLEPAVVFRG